MQFSSVFRNLSHSQRVRSTNADQLTALKGAKSGVSRYATATLALALLAGSGAANAVNINVGVKDTTAWGTNFTYQNGGNVRTQTYNFTYTPNTGGKGLLLTFSGFDLERESNGLKELSILVDGQFYRFAQPTVDGRQRTVRIPILDSAFSAGNSHTIQFYNNIGANETWGMRNVWLRRLVGQQQTVTLGQTLRKPLGYRYGSNAHPEVLRYAVQLSAADAARDLRIDAVGYDQNKYGETQVRILNSQTGIAGQMLGYMKTGARKAIAPNTSFVIDSSETVPGLNYIEFKQRAVGNRWGISSFKIARSTTTAHAECSISDSKPVVDNTNTVTNQVLVLPGDDLVAIAQANPAGTEYLITRGQYRLRTPIVPENKDKFICEPGTILSGAIRLNSSGATRNGATWQIRGVPSVVNSDWQPGSRQKYFGFMKNGREVNRVPFDLFVNNKLYMRVDSLAKVNDTDVKFGNRITHHGTFFQNGSNVFLPMDPRRLTVEFGQVTNAFQSLRSSNSDNEVVIENCTVEKFASRDISAAIDASAANKWTVRKVNSRFNHTGGVIVGTNTDVLCGRMEHNGQNGVSGTFSPVTGADGQPAVPLQIANRSSNAFIKGVVASYNNWAGYNEQWHAGGMKFVATNGLRIENNNVTRNYGVGIWLDFEVLGSVVRRNNVSDNAGRGIQIEVSKGATVDFNLVRCNARLSDYALDRSWFWASNILAKNSANVNIRRNNVIVDHGQGISIVDNLFTGRFFDNSGYRRAYNNKVNENTISFTTRAAPGGNAQFTHHMVGLESDGPGSTGGNGAKNCTPPEDFLDQGLVSSADISQCLADGGINATLSTALNNISDNTYRIPQSAHTYWRHDGTLLAQNQVPLNNAKFNAREITLISAAQAPVCR